MPIKNVERVYYHDGGMEMATEPALRKEVVLPINLCCQAILRFSSASWVAGSLVSDWPPNPEPRAIVIRQ
jgi:hypothetical protein